jgi:hypothetical protein
VVPVGRRNGEGASAVIEWVRESVPEVDRRAAAYLSQLTASAAAPGYRRLHAGPCWVLCETGDDLITILPRPHQLGPERPAL